MLKTESLLNAKYKSSRYLQAMNPTGSARINFNLSGDEQQQEIYSSYLTKKSLNSLNANMRKSSAGMMAYRLFEMEDRMPIRRMTEA